MSRAVCLFGLSADPPTGEGGHLGIVKALSALSEFDEIRVLPVYRHTFTKKQGRLVSFEHRLRMCEAAFGSLRNVTVSDAEYRSWLHAAQGLPDEQKEKLSVGTACLLDYLRSTEPGSVFTFCLGADAFMDLTDGKWKESDRVINLLGGRFLVFYRHESREQWQNDKQLRRRVQRLTGAKLLKVDHLQDVSSSQVRASTSVDYMETMVSPQVLKYMREHNLYFFEDSS